MLLPTWPPRRRCRFPASPKSVFWPASAQVASSTNKLQRVAPASPQKLCPPYDLQSPARPPQPTITRIIEIIVHGEDIRRPLHIMHDYSTIHIAEALDYLTRDGSSGAKARLAGLRLHATDTDADIGDGQLVEGPAVALLLAASGRSVALPDLSGSGEQTLSERLRPTTPP
jgi:hypothetical protein